MGNISPIFKEGERGAASQECGRLLTFSQTPVLRPCLLLAVSHWLRHGRTTEKTKQT